MNILVVHDIGALEGGAEVLITRTTRELQALGHTVRVLTSDNPPPTFADATFTAGDATVLGKLSRYLYNSSAKRALAHELETFKPDVVHVHTVTKASPAIMPLLKNVPTVMTLHDYGLMYPRLHTVLPKSDYCGYGDVACCARHAGLFRYYFESVRVKLFWAKRKNVSIYIAPSRFVAQIAATLGYKPVVPLVNGIDLAPVGKTAHDAQTVLFAGRLEAEKGIVQLLDAFALVYAELPHAKLVVAGEGLLHQEVQARIAALGLQNAVELKGQLPYAELAALYQRATALAVPSLWPEPFGLIGPEAMQYSTPIVTSGKGGIAEWAHHDQNSLIVDPTDTPAHAQAIVRVLTDAPLRAKLSAQAKKDAQQFTMARYATELVAIYERARTRHAA